MGQVVHRKHLFIIIVTVVVLATFLVLHFFGFTGLGSRMEFQTVQHSFSRGNVLGNEGYCIIQNMDEWTEICTNSSPGVDFSKETVIALFYGVCPSVGSYWIEVKEIVDTGLTIIVKVEKIHRVNHVEIPIQGHPYHIVKLNKIDKHVIFQTSTREITD